MGNNRVSIINSQIFVVLTVLGALASGFDNAQASFLNSCTTYCHGMPPRDSFRKGNPHFASQSSAFLGNHRNHLSTAPVAADCAICHMSVAPVNFSHENEVIAMANSLKGYSSATVRAKYDKGIFVNQTSIPNLTNATCSNVSCHFETKTPVWNSPAYVAPANCNGCHGFPPSGTAVAPSGGLDGSHARHNAYFPGTSGCQKCHPGYPGFAHASSAGRPLRVQGYLRDPLNNLESSATYSGTGANYLPSQSSSKQFGSCNNLYCHSNSGPNATAKVYTPAAWNGGVLNCGSCHADMSTIASTVPNGNHYTHASITYTAGARFACSVCHGTGYTSSSITTSTHVNRLVELSFTGSASGTAYSKAAPITAGTSWGNCSASLCHGSGNPVWGGNLWSTTDQCGKCHSSSTAGSITQTVPFYSTSYPVKVTSNTDAKVGAHTNHMTSQSLGISASTACSDCHGTVTLTAGTHMNGTTNFAWSALATKNGALIPTYTTGTRVCANVYCHGASMPGGDTTGTNRSPVWNVPFMSATLSRAACASCHGFPPATTSGHPAVTMPASWPAVGAVTGALGTTCSCHPNISSTGTTYANIFVNKSLHIDGTLQVSGGHAVPYDTHYIDVKAAGNSTACLGCHAIGTAASVYPAPVTGNPPDCMSCHIKAAPLSSGTTAGANCSSCHGLSTATSVQIGRPTSTAYPDRVGFHNGSQDSAHGTSACSVCHSGIGTSGGSGSGINHGKGSTAGPVRNGKPNVVGPMVNGITPTNSAKGVGIPANGTTCVHGTINSGCSGGGTKTNTW